MYVLPFMAIEDSYLDLSDWWNHFQLLNLAKMHFSHLHWSEIWWYAPQIDYLSFSCNQSAFLLGQQQHFLLNGQISPGQHEFAFDLQYWDHPIGPLCSSWEPLHQGHQLLGTTLQHNPILILIYLRTLQHLDHCSLSSANRYAKYLVFVVQQMIWCYVWNATT